MKKIKYRSKEDGQEQNDFVNSAYWEKRVANHIWNSYNSLEEENYALLKHYEKLSDDIRLQLYSLTEHEKSGDLTRTQRYLKAHLQELQKNITKKCEELGDKVESEAIKNISKEIKSDYQNSFVSISEENFHQLSTNQCKEIINNPWHGSYFSKRLWGNTAKLAEDLNQILSVGITEGKTIAAMAIQLANRTNQELNKAHRLIRTETINSLNRSALRGYKDADVQFVRWWAAVDERTCEVCGENHGKVYSIDKAPNLPCHPGCRCTWLPVFEDELTPKDFQSTYKLTDDEMYSLNTYISSGAYGLNEALRNSEVLSKEQKKIQDSLDAALKKLDHYSGILKRSLTFYSDEAMASFLKIHVAGEKITYKEFISTTRGDTYSPYANVQIYIQNAKSGYDLSNLNKKEKEVLYKRNSSFKILNRITKDDVVYILMEEDNDG